MEGLPNGRPSKLRYYSKIPHVYTRNRRTSRGADRTTRVLTVDNDQPHADATESLSRAGYDCTVSDGPTALTLIDENIYDLIFTDLVMPEVDGMAILRHTKEALPEAEVSYHRSRQLAQPLPPWNKERSRIWGLACHTCEQLPIV